MSPEFNFFKVTQYTSFGTELDFFFNKIMEPVDFYYKRTHGITRQASSLELKSPYQAPCQFEEQTLCTDAGLENVYFVCCKNQLFMLVLRMQYFVCSKINFHIALEKCGALYVLKTNLMLITRMWYFVLSKINFHLGLENVVLCIFYNPLSSWS
jgi:hypothetical protein